MRKVQLGNTGEMIPILGQGLWGVSRLTGFFKGKKYYEKIKESIRIGIAQGLTHIDTAEMYGWGKAEEVLGKVLKEYQRDELFITSKLFPIHPTKSSMIRAAKNSLKRLGIEYLDLYLIHWPTKLISIQKEMEVLEELVKKEKVRYIGVSNFSVEQFKEAQSYLKDVRLINNQLNINITKQKYIHQALKFYQMNEITVTAYSPLAHRGYTELEGPIRDDLESVAKNHNATIQQIAIAWLINHKNIITIPKAFNKKHMIDNSKASEIMLTEKEIQMFYKHK